MRLIMPVLQGLPARVLLLLFWSILRLPLAAQVPANPAVTRPVERWVVDFQSYAAQPKIEVERRYMMREPSAGNLTLSGLLRTLPEPAEWPRLRAALAGAAAQAPAGAAQQRLQAGGWLLAYLLGDRAALLAELPAIDPHPQSQSAAAIHGLRRSLDENSAREGESPGEQLKSFEQQLIMLEPVDLADVKRVLDGEENFARFQRLWAAGKAMNEKMQLVFEEYEKTKDEAAARKQAEALQQEFQQASAVDEKILEPYLQKPEVQRYMMSLAQEQAMPQDYIPGVFVPDLVKLAGPERATALLRRALHLRLKLSVNKESGEATRRLARELALAEVATLPVPSWGLTHDVEAGALFEALRARFPEPDAKDYDFKQAGGYYLAGLIQHGRTAEAVAFASRQRPEAGAGLELPYEVMRALEKGGQAPELWVFLKAWLSQHPGVDEWDRFNRLSAQLGRQDELRALIKELAANGAFAGLDRLKVQAMQADAELATDDLAAAATRLGAIVQSPAATIGERHSQLDLAVKLLQLADLRDDKPGFATALAAAEALLEKNWAEKPGDTLGGATRVITTLNSQGRLEDGARLGRATLARVAELKQKAAKEAAARKAAAPQPDEDERELLSFPDYELKNLLSEQLRAAVELGRWPEALALMQENTGWQAGDVGELLEQTVSSSRRPVAYYMAQVARHQKDDARARRILEAQLVATPGNDGVYEAYLGLAKQDARPLLAKLAASDRYEERPLIWLAKLQSDAGEWDPAIATLQQAIGIDPSDGEEGRGDRMRVYAFMGRALAAKGDAEKARFFEGVVKSIRLSETADRWFEIGAYAHAIALYRQALRFFQDAYCIQSRLAVRLADQGKMDEAAEHYRRAFELMPDSFGRVESHCFGCEHVFAGEKSQGVAEEVFARMLAARPDKPQLHYLMGYLRKEQERPAEAAEHFRKAVQLDPLYLNAWDKLADLDAQLKFPPAQRDDLLLKLVELDPARRHVSPDLEKVTALGRLWTVLTEARRTLAALPAPGPLWPLKASAEQLGKRDADPTGLSSARSEKDFAAVLIEHRFVEALQTYLAGLNAEAGEDPQGKPAS